MAFTHIFSMAFFSLFIRLHAFFLQHNIFQLRYDIAAAATYYFCYFPFFLLFFFFPCFHFLPSRTAFSSTFFLSSSSDICFSLPYRYFSFLFSPSFLHFHWGLFFSFCLIYSFLLLLPFLSFIYDNYFMPSSPHSRGHTYVDISSDIFFFFFSGGDRYRVLLSDADMIYSSIFSPFLHYWYMFSLLLLHYRYIHIFTYDIERRGFFFCHIIFHLYVGFFFFSYHIFSRQSDAITPAFLFLHMRKVICYIFMSFSFSSFLSFLHAFSYDDESLFSSRYAAESHQCLPFSSSSAVI